MAKDQAKWIYKSIAITKIRYLYSWVIISNVFLSLGVFLSPIKFENLMVGIPDCDYTETLISKIVKAKVLYGMEQSCQL